MYIDTAPFILPSEAAAAAAEAARVAAVCIQERENEYDYILNYYKEEEENEYDYI